MNLFLKKKLHKESGFTLVEMLVSLSIFTFVSTAAVGVLLVMIDANRKSQNIQTAMSNLSFALDSMTRDIRTGTNYYCDNSADNAIESSGGGGPNCDSEQVFAFTESGNSLTQNCSGANSSRIGYRLNGGQVERYLCGSWEGITSSEVNVTTLDFVLTGADRTDPDVPILTIFMEGRVNDVGGNGADFRIQTSITQQLLDI